MAALVWAFNDLALLHDSDGVGHGAHLGGALFGAIVYAIRMVLISQNRTKVLEWLRDVARSRRKRSRLWKAIKAGAVKVVSSIDEN